MHYFEAETSIEATPSDVWAVLTDAAAWPTWDSGVDAVDGRIQLDEKLTIRSHVAPERAFPVKVTELDAPQAMTFTGGMPLGLFKGVRRYSLTGNDDGSTHFRMREEYTGVMLGMIWKSIPDLSGSFSQFADGLKKRVESAG
ncbi:MAG: hypothetical protein JWQ64_956 [Subtercola sp.]|jgi:hypothetical protein|nr:hypothetical protein [Subtercola sp.]